MVTLMSHLDPCLFRNCNSTKGRLGCSTDGSMLRSYGTCFPSWSSWGVIQRCYSIHSDIHSDFIEIYSDSRSGIHSDSWSQATWLKWWAMWCYAARSAGWSGYFPKMQHVIQAVTEVVPELAESVVAAYGSTMQLVLFGSGRRKECTPSDRMLSWIWGSQLISNRIPLISVAPFLFMKRFAPVPDVWPPLPPDSLTSLQELSFLQCTGPVDQSGEESSVLSWICFWKHCACLDLYPWWIRAVLASPLSLIFYHNWNTPATRVRHNWKVPKPWWNSVSRETQSSKIKEHPFTDSRLIWSCGTFWERCQMSFRRLVP